MGTITRTFANNITTGGKFDATDLTGTLPASTIADASVTAITDVPALVATTTVATDPPSPDNGQMWYNTTDRRLKAYVLSGGTWVTGGALNQAKSQLAGFGTQTSVVAGGGDTPGETANTETYNGTAWTETSNMQAATRLAQGIGTSPAGLAAGGYQPPGYQTKNESWDGSGWTEVADLNSNKGAGGGAGTQTAGLAFAGVPGGPMATNESWDGSSWTEVGDLNGGRRHLGGIGISTAALAIGGDKPSPSPGALTESWDGSSWTEVADLNTGRSTLSWGVQTLAGTAGGHTGSYVTSTELWDGTSWTESSDMSTGRKEGGASGKLQSAGLYFGGEAPRKTDTEEWTQTIFSKKLTTTE